ncbi:MAG: amidase [Cyclobacteriaceae bacterium]|nr:amidase [Cyclobacteriaceae bacterium]
MNTIKSTIIAFLGLFILHACKTTYPVNQGVTVENIAGAEQLYGIKFTPSERDSMQDYLKRNLKGYEERRQYTLNNNVGMALYFDPRPQGFHFTQNGTDHQWVADTTVKLPISKEELAFLPIPQLAGLIKTGQITSEDLTAFYIERIKTYDPFLSSVITLTEERALREARRADKEIASGNYKGVLHGIPFGIKDLLSTEGYNTTWGASPFKDQLIDEDAEVVKRLNAQGAVLIAKLSSGALASGDVWYGGKTKNPWNLEQGASGSSAGPGSATSAGLVPFSIGSETWGSIISPSSTCGITGLRPTFGRVSRYGAMTLSWSMDKLGPIARNSLDCAIVLDAIYGYDDKDRATVPYAFKYRLDVQKLRVGYFKELFDEEYDDKENDLAVLDLLKKEGFELIPLEMPDSIPFGSMATIIRAESGALFDELVYKNLDDLMVRQTRFARPTTLRQSQLIPAVEYIQANRYRAVLIEKLNKTFEEVDVIISPTSGGNQSLMTNLTGHPAISIPNGFDEEGSPTSITFIGGLYKDNAILQLGTWYQEQTDFEEKHPVVEDWETR